MTQDTKTNYLGPFITMVFLFLVVGFLTTANTQFQGPLKEVFLSEAGGLKNTFATLITFSWFLAYPVFGPVGSRWVNKRGYKGTLMGGLAMMTAGLVIFFLSSYYTVHFPESYLDLGSTRIPAGFILFLLGSFVVGGSATVLQVVINPYLSACHVRGTQPVQRLAVGGTANSVGTTLAPYFVTGVVFGGLSMDEVSVNQLQIPFICLAAVIILIAAILFKVSLPDIEGTRSEGNEKLDRSVWSFRHLTLGVIAIFFYVGAEVCVGGNINLYAIERGDASPALLATIYWGLMLAGRLCGSMLSKVSPRVQLTVTTSCATLLLVLALVLDNVWLLCFTGLFHSIMWGAIFTLATSRLGKYTSAASGVFMIGVFGGAVLPLLQGVFADAAGSWRWTWALVVLCELIMLSYALWGSKIKESYE